MKIQFDSLPIAIIALFIGIGIFICGMNAMSDGLKKATGKGLKKLLKRTQKSSIAGFGIGASVTALIQSSAATSIMVIGFINAGIMTIFQGISIILGAYVGTTITGLIASLSTFDISIYFIFLVFIGIVLVFFKNEKIKYIGQILSGLGLLFLGLLVLKQAFSYQEIRDFLVQLFTDISFPPLLLLIGALITALVQSSSATSGIIIALVSATAGNTALFASGMYLVLGATIGTVITTLIATIGGNANSKRTAVMCLLLRITTALIALAIIWPLETQFTNFFMNLIPNSPGLSLAIFLILYNVIFMLILLPFVKYFEKLSIKLIKDKSEEKIKNTIKYIDERFLNTPSVALMQARREIINMSELSRENYINGYERIVTQNDNKDSEIIEIEDKIDYLNNKITGYLILLSNKVDSEDEKVIGSYFHIINDIERIGDHGYNFYEQSLKMQENDLKFSQNAVDGLNKMHQIILEMYEMALNVLHEKNIDLKKLHNLEEETDNLKNVLSDDHFKRILENKCTMELSPFYSTVVTELERIADHLTNVGYSTVNPTGDDEIKN